MDENKKGEIKMDENKNWARNNLKKSQAEILGLVYDFTPTGETKDDGIDIWAKCASNCGVGIFSCFCRGEVHCVDKWHRLHFRTGELDPREFSNHADKPKSNNYNT